MEMEGMPVAIAQQVDFRAKSAARTP
jgi:hypothetical protein